MSTFSGAVGQIMRRREIAMMAPESIDASPTTLGKAKIALFQIWIVLATGGVLMRALSHDMPMEQARMWGLALSTLVAVLMVWNARARR